MPNDNNIPLSPQLMQDFQQVYGMILSHRKRAAAAVDGEMLLMIWEVGGYVSLKLKSAAWGDGVVRQLSDYIRTQDPTSRGWSYRTVYKMVQLYEAYSRSEFTELVSHMNVSEFARPQLPASAKPEFVPIEMAQIGTPEIVPIQLAQIPNVLFATGWSNHQIIRPHSLVPETCSQRHYEPHIPTPESCSRIQHTLTSLACPRNTRSQN